jgi:hypothetical protein
LVLVSLNFDFGYSATKHKNKDSVKSSQKDNTPTKLVEEEKYESLDLHNSREDAEYWNAAGNDSNLSEDIPDPFDDMESKLRKGRLILNIYHFTCLNVL